MNMLNVYSIELFLLSFNNLVCSSNAHSVGEKKCNFFYYNLEYLTKTKEK